MEEQGKKQWKDLVDDEEEEQQQQQQQQPQFAQQKLEKKENQTLNNDTRENQKLVEGATEKKYPPKYGNKSYTKGPPKRKHKVEYLEQKKQGIKCSKNIYDMESSSEEEEDVDRQEKFKKDNYESKESDKEQPDEVVEIQKKKTASKKEQQQHQLNELEAALKEVGLSITTEHKEDKQEGEKKKKKKKQKQRRRRRRKKVEQKTEVEAEIKPVEQESNIIDAATAAKEALLKRAQQQQNFQKIKSALEIAKAKQEILNRQNKVKRAQGKKKEDL